MQNRKRRKNFVRMLTELLTLFEIEKGTSNRFVKDVTKHTHRGNPRTVRSNTLTVMNCKRFNPNISSRNHEDFQG